MSIRRGRVPGADCTRPAVRVVEGYAPKNGRFHGSLDALVWVCEEHHEACRNEWVPALRLNPHSLGVPADSRQQCGSLLDFRDTTSGAAQAVEAQPVGEMSLLEPMPYRLEVNGAMAMRGTLQQVRAAVAHLITEWLGSDPEGLALDAQTVNMAFNSGAVAEALDERGEWFTIVGAHSEAPNRIKVTREG